MYWYYKDGIKMGDGLNGIRAMKKSLMVFIKIMFHGGAV